MQLKFKVLKYYLSRSRILRYFRIIIQILVKKNINFFFKEKKIEFLGQFSTKINFFNIDEVLSLKEDIDYIQGFRYFINEKTKFFIYSSKSNLLYNFFSDTLNCETIILKENFINKFKKNYNLKIVNNKKFFSLINNSKNSNNIFISESQIFNKNLDFLNNFKYIFVKFKISSNNKKFFQYNYDFFGKISIHNTLYKKFYLYSKFNLIKKKSGNGITGLACLKNLELYPFDICFESALRIVDEMIIGIDKNSYKNKKKQYLIKKFLKQTKYKSKIKIHIFNFNSSTTTKCMTRGRWIADVFNKLSNLAENKYVMICGADELFDYKLKNKLNKKLLACYDEIVLRFYHFIFNFKYIRDPKHAAYNFWNRIVKVEKYVSNGDGMGFVKNTFKYPKINYLSNPIYHIGYVLNYKKKIKTHLNKNNGVFGNRWNLKEYMLLMKPIKTDKYIQLHLRKNLYQLKYMNGFKIIKKDFNL